MQPGEDDHPRLRELWQESAAPLTWWRMRYNLPPNSPLVLDADEDMVLDDLLLISFNDLRNAIAKSPSLGVATDPAAVKAFEQAQNDAAMVERTKRQMERIRQFEERGGKPEAKRPPASQAPTSSATMLQKLNPWGRHA
jgi:hypothetical protein